MTKVIVMGKGVLAEKISEWFFDSKEYNLIYLVPNNPESTWTVSLKSIADKKGISIIESGDYKDINPREIDLIVSVTYEKIIKDSFIRKVNRIINIHNGPLPQYRGVNPINWALKNNERKHGVTIHDILAGIDNGPIISKVLFPVNPEVDEVIDVYERCMNFGWKLFKETIPDLWNIKPYTQDEKLANYYSKDDFSKLKERSYFTRKESIEKLNLDNQ